MSIPNFGSPNLSAPLPSNFANDMSFGPKVVESPSFRGARSNVLKFTSNGSSSLNSPTSKPTKPIGELMLSPKAIPPTPEVVLPDISQISAAAGVLPDGRLRHVHSEYLSDSLYPLLSRAITTLCEKVADDPEIRKYWERTREDIVLDQEEKKQIENKFLKEQFGDELPSSSGEEDEGDELVKKKKKKTASKPAQSPGMSPPGSVLHPSPGGDEADYNNSEQDFDANRPDDVDQSQQVKDASSFMNEREEELGLGDEDRGGLADPGLENIKEEDEGDSRN